MDMKICLPLMLLMASPIAIADAFVCQVGDKKIFQTEPCQKVEQTRKQLRINEISAAQAAQGAQAAQREVERQREWLTQQYRQRAIESQIRQESLREAAAKQAAYEFEQQKRAAEKQAIADANEEMRYLQSLQAPQIDSSPEPAPHVPNIRPSTITDQGNGFMRDNLGNNYMKNGNFLYGNGGTRCLKNGNFYNCN